MQKKCEILENKKKDLKQVLNIKSYMVTRMVEKSKVECYKQGIKERETQDAVEKNIKVNLFLPDNSLILNVP